MFILANVIQEAFSPLISLFQAILVFVHSNIVGGSWGLAIIGMTVLIRAIMVPLTFRQFRAMQSLQRLAPEIKALQEKYKDDKQRQQQEMMNFYKEQGVNPFASCLPLLLQLPVFVSLFYMLRADLKKHICGPALVRHYNELSAHARSGYNLLHASGVAKLPAKYLEKTACNTVQAHSAKFLFLPDITSKATGVSLVVLLLLYVGSQVFSTLLMGSATMDKNQRMMMLALPLFFVIILYRYPAGLLVYWITTNLWTIGQGYFVRRRLGPIRPSPSGEDGKGPPPTTPSPNGSRSSKPALAGVTASPSAPPRQSPRKRKKRSGRRR